MTPPTLVPDKNTLERLLAEGRTHREIAQVYGVARATISAACARYGISPNKTRHSDTVPWKVLEVHAREYPVRMLRLLGRRRKNMSLTENEARMLDAFLVRLRKEQAIVAYDPDSAEGFCYISQKWKDHDDPEIPIRRGIIHLNGASS